MARGYAHSTYTLLGAVFFVIPGAFGFLLWRSYARERRRIAGGQSAYSPPGKERW